MLAHTYLLIIAALRKCFHLHVKFLRLVSTAKLFYRRNFPNLWYTCMTRQAVCSLTADVSRRPDLSCVYTKNYTCMTRHAVCSQTTDVSRRPDLSCVYSKSYTCMTRQAVCSLTADVSRRPDLSCVYSKNYTCMTRQAVCTCMTSPQLCVGMLYGEHVCR